MATRNLVWQAADGIGLEYVLITETPDSVQIDSNVIGSEEKQPFCLRYQLRCEANYRVQDVDLQLVGGKSLKLSSNGEGHWFDAEKKPISALNGCIDVDITATPFTNTLPIRRVTWEIGQKQTFLMAYILVPTLDFYADEQHYTLLERNGGGSLYFFESMSTNFTAQIMVDANGLVIDYPGLFKRVRFGD